MTDRQLRQSVNHQQLNLQLSSVHNTPIHHRMSSTERIPPQTAFKLFARFGR